MIELFIFIIGLVIVFSIISFLGIFDEYLKKQNDYQDNILKEFKMVNYKITHYIIDKEKKKRK